MDNALLFFQPALKINQLFERSHLKKRCTEPQCGIPENRNLEGVIVIPEERAPDSSAYLSK
jgi:hypothetical protein